MAIPKQDWLSDAIDEETGAYEGALYDSVKGDKLPNLKRAQEEKKKKKSSGLGSFLGMAGGIVGNIYGGPAGGMAGSAIGQGVGAAIDSKEGGQIESNLKTQKKNTAKKKRVVRGVGAAKRGYGKATYSKKMY